MVGAVGAQVEGRELDCYFGCGVWPIRHGGSCRGRRLRTTNSMFILGVVYVAGIFCWPMPIVLDA